VKHIVDHPNFPPRVCRVFDFQFHMADEVFYCGLFSILSWSMEEEIVSGANDTNMGLGGSVWSNNLVQAKHLARKIESDTACVKCYFQLRPHIPFGDHK
jgi:acyl-CoA reductase-like NAD-dependent aldehyde dehydrogenase